MEFFMTTDFNIFKNQTFKRICLVIILLFIYVLISAVSYAGNVSADIQNSVFRLHVIANSDSAQDQNLKYLVRDKLIEYMNSISKDCSSKSDVITLANEHKQDFYNIAKNVITENGYDYDVNINIGNFDFPTKHYGDIALPAGNYDALRVEIGKAKGQNWWCVMFPPLCFVDVSSGIVPDESKAILQENLTDEEYKIISNQSNPDMNFKFGLLEILII